MEKLKTKTMGYIAAGVVALGAVGAGLGITQPWKQDEEPEPPAPPQEIQTPQPGRPDGYLTVGGKQIPCTLHEGDGWSILVPQEWRIDGDETHLAAVPELGSSVELAVGPGSLEKGPRGVSCYQDDDGTMNRIFFLGEGEKQLEVSCRAPEDQWEDYKFTLAAMAKSFTVDGEQPFQDWSPLPEEPQWQMADGVTVLWLDKDGVALDGEAGKAVKAKMQAWDTDYRSYFTGKYRIEPLSWKASYTNLDCAPYVDIFVGQVRYELADPAKAPADAGGGVNSVVNGWYSNGIDDVCLAVLHDGESVKAVKSTPSVGLGRPSNAAWLNEN